jgi:glutaredoxin
MLRFFSIDRSGSTQVLGMYRALLAIVVIASGCHPRPPIREKLDAALTCDRVVIYSSSGCAPCRWAKDHAKQRGVTSIVVRDVDDDAEAERFVRSLNGGRISVPVLEVCGATLNGYGPDWLDRELTKPR